MAHYFLTEVPTGGLVCWLYIIGSATAGIRRYETTCGMQRRLQAHNNRYWDTKRREADTGDESLVEDDGMYFDNPNVDSESCYAPVSQQGEEDWQGPSWEPHNVDIKELTVNCESFLENDD